MDAAPGAVREPALKGRTTAFRVIAAIGGALAAGLSIPFAIVGILEADGEGLFAGIHRFHNVAGAAGLGLLVGIALVLVAWRPAWINPFQGVMAVTIVVLAVGLASGDLIQGGYIVQVVIVAVVLGLHPSRGEVFALRPPSASMAVLPALGLVPAVAYALSQSVLQREGVTANPHVEFHHYSGMALLGVALCAGGLVASLRSNGYRVTAWLAGVGTIVVGAASVAYRDHESAFDSPWGWVTIAGGVIFVAVAEWQARVGGEFE
jgi:hypothetical protein